MGPSRGAIMGDWPRAEAVSGKRRRWKDLVLSGCRRRGDVVQDNRPPHASRILMELRGCGGRGRWGPRCPGGEALEGSSPPGRGPVQDNHAGLLVQKAGKKRQERYQHRKLFPVFRVSRLLTRMLHRPVGLHSENTGSKRKSVRIPRRQQQNV